MAPTCRWDDVEWLRAGAVACVVVAAFWAPGMLIGWAARLRGLMLAATAPLLTLGVAGTSALVAEQLGVPWAPGTALLAVLVTAGVTAGCARRVSPRARPAPRAQGAARRWLAVAVAAGVLAQLVPLATGMGRPGRLLTAHDALAHFAMVRFVRESGSASSLTITGAHTLDGATQGFYGGAWHAVAALLGDGPGASTIFNLAVLVPCSLAWTLGLTALTRSALPSRPRAWCFAAAASGAGIALPVYLVMRPEGMVPNAIAVALVPAFVALATSPWWHDSPAWWCVVLVGAAGLALTHPNAAAAAGLVLAPWIVLRGRRSVTVLLGSWRGRAVLATALVTAGLLVARLATTDRMRAVVGFEPEPPVPLWEALVRLFSGDATGMGWASGATVVLAAVVGAVLSRRAAHARWLVLAAVLMAALYLAATSSVPVLTDVDRLWYGEPRRFAPVIVAVLVPLAARALDAVDGALRVAAARRPDRSGPPARTTGLLVGVALLATSTVASGVGLDRLARYSFGDGTAGGEVVVADDAELEMLGRAGQLLDPAVGVLGSPFSGAAHLFGLHGQRVVPPTYLTEEDDDLRYLREHLDDLGRDPRVCAALGRLGVGYLYTDPQPWNVLPTHVNPLRPPDEGVELLDSGGSARLYTITAC